MRESSNTQASRDAPHLEHAPDGVFPCMSGASQHTTHVTTVIFSRPWYDTSPERTFVYSTQIKWFEV